MPRLTAPHWSERVRALHDWSLRYDWETHLCELNEKWGLEGNYRLSLPMKDWPPAWFNGDIASLEADNWILVVSLNPALAREGHYDLGKDKAESWAFWSNHNRDERNWNTNSGFFPRMIRLGAAALGREATDPRQFATENMLFLEFCPYASKAFTDKDWASVVQRLADSDVGFAINRQIRHLAMLHGKPRMVILHGVAAINDVKDHQCPDLTFRYEEDPNDSKRFRVWQGEFKGFGHHAPVIGFAFLGRPGNMPGPDRRVEILEEIFRRMAG